MMLTYRSVQTRQAIALPAAMVCLLATGNSSANEYSLDYGVEAGYEYNDNIRLSPDNEEDVSGGRIALPATLTSRSERLTASLGGQLTFSKYDESAYDSDDQDINGKAAYLTERGDFDGYVGYLRDSTRTSEFLDTGLVGPSAERRERFQAGTSVSHLFTSKNGIVAGIDYRDVEFDSVRLQNYDSTSGYAGWLHKWSEITQLRLQGYAARFENDDNIPGLGSNTVKTDTLGAQFGFDSEYSENLQTSLLAGWANVETDYDSALLDDDENGALLLQGSTVYKQERYQLGVTVLSQPSASGNGTAYDTSRLNVDYQYRLTERSNMKATFILGHNSAMDDELDNDRDFARVRLRTDYRISQSWYVAGYYQYSYQDRERATGDADSNEVGLDIIFRPEKSVWSR